MVDQAAGTSSFLTPCQGETQVGEYEIYHRRRGFCIGDAVAMLLWVLVGFGLWAKVDYDVRHGESWTVTAHERFGLFPPPEQAPGAPEFTPETDPGIAKWPFLLFTPVPYLLGILLFRRERRGWLVLTDPRLVYYQRDRWALGGGHLQVQVNLEDVCGMNADYHRTWLGQEGIGLSVLTSFNDHIAIGAGKQGLPLLRLLRPSSIGKDAFRVLPTLYALVDQCRTRPRQETTP